MNKYVTNVRPTSIRVEHRSKNLTLAMNSPYYRSETTNPSSREPSRQVEL